MESQNDQQGHRAYKFCVAYTTGGVVESYAYPTRCAATEHLARRMVIEEFLLMGRWVARIKLDKCDA